VSQTEAQEGARLQLTPGEFLEVRRSTPGMLEVEVEYGPGRARGAGLGPDRSDAIQKAPPAHFHPAQSEHFEVLEGILRVRVDGEDRELRRGQTLDIPPGSVHQLWNTATMPCRVTWQIMPRGRTEEWFRALDAANARAAPGGRPSLVTFAALLTEYGDVMQLAARPRPLVRVLLAGLARLKR
jgi:mannose-6-phosphate isomerase-like protein (cupin superfamily)